MQLGGEWKVMLRQLSVVPLKSIGLALNIHAALFSVVFSVHCFGFSCERRISLLDYFLNQLS